MHSIVTYDLGWKNVQKKRAPVHELRLLFWQQYGPEVILYSANALLQFVFYYLYIYSFIYLGRNVTVLLYSTDFTYLYYFYLRW